MSAKAPQTLQTPVALFLHSDGALVFGHDARGHLVRDILERPPARLQHLVSCDYCSSLPLGGMVALEKDKAHPTVLHDELCRADEHQWLPCMQRHRDGPWIQGLGGGPTARYRHYCSLVLRCGASPSTSRSALLRTPAALSPLVGVAGPAPWSKAAGWGLHGDAAGLLPGGAGADPWFRQQIFFQRGRVGSL